MSELKEIGCPYCAGSFKSVDKRMNQMGDLVYYGNCGYCNVISPITTEDYITMIKEIIGNPSSRSWFMYPSGEMEIQPPFTGKDFSRRNRQ